MKENIYDEGGYMVLHDTIHALFGGVSGGAGYAPVTDGGSKLPEEGLSLSSLFSFGHHNPFPHQVTADPHHQLGLLPKHHLDGDVMPDRSVDSYHHHHGPQHCHDPLALPAAQGDGTPSPASMVMYDHLAAQVDLCHQNSMVVNVLQWLPNEYGFVPLSVGVAGDSVCDGRDEGYMRQSVSPVFGFGEEMGGMRRRSLKGNENTEKQRRGKMTEKFDELRSLIPNPRKHDRASVIAEATDYVKELLRTINELGTLVETKRKRRGSRKTSVTGEAEAEADMQETSPVQHCGSRPSNELLRGYWLQRNLKDMSVDVRIVEEEVTIKLVLRRKAGGCLLIVARALHDLQLELLHLAAGNIGDSHVLMISSKIDEGSSVYASAIAKKLIESLDATAPGRPF